MSERSLEFSPQPNNDQNTDPINNSSEKAESLRELEKERGQKTNEREREFLSSP